VRHRLLPHQPLRQHHRDLQLNQARQWRHSPQAGQPFRHKTGLLQQFPRRSLLGRFASINAASWKFHEPLPMRMTIHTLQQ